MPQYFYKTIELESQGLYKEKGSKFLAFAFPVANEGDVKMRLESLRKKYFDARHHCYAYRLGNDGQNFRANDDGEPNHSAGDPILGQLRSKDITNALIVVVRYFGGVKLGVGGLIAAYRAAAEDALVNNRIFAKEIKKAIRITYGHENTAEVMRMIKEFQLEIKSQIFEERNVLEGYVSLRLEQQLLEKVSFLIALGNDVTVELLE